MTARGAGQRPLSAIASIVRDSVLWRTILAAAIAQVVALGAIAAHPDTAEDFVDTRVYWLQVALVCVATFAISRIFESWPGFGRDRSEALWLRRLRIGPSGGCVAAIAIGMACMLPALVGLAVAFDGTARHGRGEGLVESVELSAAGRDRLDASHPTLDLLAGRRVHADEIVLRPVPVIGRDTRVGAVQIDVAIDGVRSASGPFALDLSKGLIHLQPRCDLDRVTVTLLDGDLALEWPPGCASLRSVLSTPRWLGAAAVGTSTLVDVALVLALAVLARRALSTPVLHFAAMATLLLIQLTGVGALGPAVAAHARDFSCLRVATRPAVLAELGLGGLAVAAALATATLRSRRCVPS